jgi:hypothetical protein
VEEGSIAVEGHMNVLYASGDVITFESNAPHGRQNGETAARILVAVLP